jgi:tetratricopeptide (TPR) repeat protein
VARKRKIFFGYLSSELWKQLSRYLQMSKFGALLGIAIFVFLSPPTLAQETSDQEASAQPSGEFEAKPVYSDDLISSGQSTSKTLALLGEKSLHTGNYEKAIQLLKQSLSMDSDDADAHCLYAQALEKKYRKQETKDPELFNKCVREWLLILRNEVGEEKGLGYKGVALPSLGTFYRDEDHNILAHQHLVKLAGSIPKGWESNSQYLKRVLQPTTIAVSGKVLKAKNTKAANKTDEYNYDDDSEQKPAQTKRNQKILQKRDADIEMEK